jgi:uncharacterized membrane protein YfcA
MGTITGGGGGLFAVPALVATINEQPSVLVGSVFFMYLATSVTGLVVYSRRKLVDYRSGIILSIPAIPGVVIGTLLESTISNFEFRLGLGVVTAFFAILMTINRRKNVTITVESSTNLSEVGTSPNNSLIKTQTKQRTIVDSSGRTFSYVPNFTLGLAINFAAGVLSGLFGAGAAVIIVPTTIIFVKLPSHVALATTRIVLMFLNVSALATHVGIGAINVYYALILATGAAIGSIIGARIAFKIHPDLLSKVIAIVLLVLGGYLVISPFV